ncbi:hypothetical protein [Streptomyces sp. NPDC051684]|uniref:hypothetical protein n=1 Tax=Streptomyces sp. NPDC051684 TaxID=3365670 RepID=UPI00379ABC0F
MTSPTTGFQPGEILTRKEIHPVLGGSGYAGICPAVEKRNVLLFSDEAVGRRYGYRDGWLAEDDEIGPIFTYTGTGKRGHQTLDGGNAAILNHAKKNRTLHLFSAEGKIEGTDTKKHRYLGAFKLDEHKPYDMGQAKDEDGQDRFVIVFRLRPIGLYIRRASDTLRPATVTRARFQRAAGKLARAYRRKRRLEQPQTEISRVEEIRDNLADSFEERETAAGMDIGQLELSMRDSTERLTLEIFNSTTQTGYLTTGSSASGSITDALAQLLYARSHLRSLTDKQPLQLMILVPELPREDIRNLLAEHEIGIVYRNGSGDFTEFAVSDTTRGIRCAGCPALA